jgi:hypothetical protein
MSDRYAYESFSSESSSFDERFSNFLNDKYADDWKVKDCSYSREGDEKTASCMFKRKH